LRESIEFSIQPFVESAVAGSSCDPARADRQRFVGN
jgi:hypothetical protein